MIVVQIVGYPSDYFVKIIGNKKERMLDSFYTF